MALSQTGSDRIGAGELTARTLRLLFRHVWLKALGTTAFTWSFFLAYFYLLQHPRISPTVMPMTPVDVWIGLQPWTLPFYLSLWVYVSLPVSVMTSRREIVGYGLRAGALCLIGLAIFYLWPTEVPTYAVDWARHPGFDILRGKDAAGNACPSLHVATAVFTAIWLDRMAPGLGFGARLRGLSLLWCALIVFSTMATKQHVLVDVICGAALGGAVAWTTRPRAWTRRRPIPTDST
ncbi:phosphatase PAP2 family protein [Thiomonas intermedia]|uniref:phosphatase PAP2 family protein n=1 Tax=Thiomonas intermedia TaxID=926 RepID=UPI0009A47AC2|nr:phosphatase PAP2 family protein [Thiomonas intermedia]